MTTIHRFAHEAMTTEFTVHIAHDDRAYAAQAAAAVFAEIDRVELLLSRFHASSDTARIAALQPGQSTRVSPETLDCLRTALRLHAETGGAFDIAFRACAAPQRGSPTTHGSSLQWLRLPDEGFDVRAEEEMSLGTCPRLELDLGAIGKGYALDAAARLLEDWELNDVLLNSGTSTVLAFGSPAANAGWPVGIGGLWGAQAGMDRIHLRNASLSGSGTEIKGGHIIDPHTAQPATSHLAAWVRTTTGAESDALATAFMVMTTDQVADYCTSHPDVAAYLVHGHPRPTITLLGQWNFD